METEPEHLGAYGVCPECLANKHDNCNGQAWNEDKDEPMECQCAHPAKPRVLQRWELP